MGGALPLESHLRRALARTTSCADKLVVARLLRYLTLPSAKQAWAVDARNCLTGLDAASTCGFLDADESIALIGEVWPRATLGEKVPMLDAVDRCTDALSEKVEAKLTFLTPQEKAAYLPLVRLRHEARLQRDLASMGADVGIRGELRQAVEACHSRCLDLYGEGSSMCSMVCTGSCGVCGEFSRICHEECGESP